MTTERKHGYWWLYRPERGKWEVIQVVRGGVLVPGCHGLATLHDGDAFHWQWGDYLGSIPGDVPLRPLLRRALDLCRSLLRFGPGGAAGAGMFEDLQKLTEEAERL